MQASKVMVSRSAGAGSVVGYNYMDDAHILSAPLWQEVVINASHMVGSHHVLFEGNESFNYDADNTHGSAIYHTVFRNHLSGFRRDYVDDPVSGNARAGGLGFGAWWHSFIGNVMGTEGRMSAWEYEDPGTRPGPWPWQGGSFIWRLGYAPSHWEQFGRPTGEEHRPATRKLRLCHHLAELGPRDFGAVNPGFPVSHASTSLLRRRPRVRLAMGRPDRGDQALHATGEGALRRGNSVSAALTAQP